MKRAFMSVSAAAIAIGVAGSIAAAAVSKSTDTAKPSAKPTAKTSAAHSASKKKDAPKISKWQQHINEMLKTSAPGDEYFGRMKMSYLGINNTFRDDLIRAGAYTTDPHLVSQIEWADDALTAWSKKYPNDPQLARSYFLAFQMYRKVWVQEYQQKAWDYAHIVIKKWPSSFFGKALTKDLAIGFTEHYFATPVACSDLAVTGSPNPSSSPSATPSPAPTPTPAPGQPKADVLPVPCLTPTPSPTPLPTGSLAPSPLPSGAPTPSPAPTGTPALQIKSSMPTPPAPTPTATHRP